LQSPLTFRYLLKDYAGVLKASEFVTRQLVPADKYQITKYVEPDYPSLGIAALILGTVNLRLRIDASTGEVQNVIEARGQAELAERASKAARQWRFTPNSVQSDSIAVAVDFRFRCP